MDTLTIDKHFEEWSSQFLVGSFDYLPAFANIGKRLEFKVGNRDCLTVCEISGNSDNSGSVTVFIQRSFGERNIKYWSFC